MHNMIQKYTWKKSVDNTTPPFFIFSSNSEVFSIEYSIEKFIDGNYPHVGLVAQRGICVLYRDIEHVWFPIDVFSSSDLNNSITINLRKYNIIGDYDIFISTPIFSSPYNISTLSITMEEEALFKLHAFSKKSYFLEVRKRLGLVVQAVLSCLVLSWVETMMLPLNESL